MGSAFRICSAACIVIAPLIAAAWLPADFPSLLRQLLLCVWGVAATVFADRMLFTEKFKDSLRAVGFTRPRRGAIVVACVASLPMWTFLPLTAWTKGVPMDLKPDWLPLLIGVVLVNGITEEVLHRGFVFGRLRRERSFAIAATVSAVVFTAQHLYIIATAGWIVGLASVGLAALLSYPLAFVFERGGHSIGGPAILHTCSNAPVMILAMPDSLMRATLLPHMTVVLVSLYGVFACRRVLENRASPRARG